MNWSRYPVCMDAILQLHFHFGFKLAKTFLIDIRLVGMCLMCNEACLLFLYHILVFEVLFPILTTAFQLEFKTKSWSLKFPVVYATTNQGNWDRKMKKDYSAWYRYSLEASRLGQNGQHNADESFKCNFLIKKHSVLINVGWSLFIGGYYL